MNTLQSGVNDLLDFILDILHIPQCCPHCHLPFSWRKGCVDVPVSDEAGIGTVCFHCFTTLSSEELLKYIPLQESAEMTPTDIEPGEEVCFYSPQVIRHGVRFMKGMDENPPTNDWWGPWPGEPLSFWLRRKRQENGWYVPPE